MNKLKQPIIYTIEGTSFEIDLDRQLLRQTNDPDNEISFINSMQDHGSHYRLLYDPESCRPAEDLFDGTRIKVIDIPPLSRLDPDGMAGKYGVSAEAMTGKTDFEIIVDQETLANRQNGILPQIDIAGEKFIVDLRLQELRHAEYFFPVLSLKSFDLTDDGWHYTAFYEPVMKQVVQIDPKLLEFPDGIIRIKIPNEIGLDPVATAKAYGMDERDLLRRYPIQRELKAEVIPLAETELPRLIRQNREQLQRDHQENMQKARPRHRPRL